MCSRFALYSDDRVAPRQPLQACFPYDYGYRFTPQPSTAIPPPPTDSGPPLLGLGARALLSKVLRPDGLIRRLCEPHRSKTRTVRFVYRHTLRHCRVNAPCRVVLIRA